MNSYLIKNLALESGVQDSEISIFLELLNATGDLKNVIVVFENLEKVIELSEQIKPFLNSINAHYFPNAEFIKALKSALLKNISSLQELSSKDFSRHGLQNTNPEYAMLLMHSQHPLFENEKFRMLQGILLYCSFEQRHRLKTGRIKSIKFEIQSACRYLRQLETGINNDLENLVLPENDWDLFQFYEANLAIVISDNFKNYFSSLIIKVHHNRGGSSRAGYKQTILKSSVKKLILNDSEESRQGPTSVELFTELSGDYKSIDEERAEGAHPNEFFESKGSKTYFSNKDPMLGFSASQHYRRQRGQIDHIASNNQLLPFRYGFLTDFELNVFGREIQLLETQDKLLALTISLSLFFGKSLRQALSIKIYNSIGLSFSFKADGIYYSLEDNSFLDSDS